VAVKQDRGPGKQPRVHAHGFAAVGADDHEALPVFALSFHLWPQLAQKALLELHDVLYSHAHDLRLARGDRTIDQQHVIEIVLTGRGNAGTLVDFAGIEQIQDGQALHIQHLVHALDAQTALAVEEVGNMGLLETRVLSQT